MKRALVLLGALFAACDQGGGGLANPTGSCTAPDRGARVGHDPGDTHWLPDCQNPLGGE